MINDIHAEEVLEVIRRNSTGCYNFGMEDLEKIMIGTLV